MAGRDEDFLSEKFRAEDVLLGALGYAEEARIVSVERCGEGYRGIGTYPDGEKFEFAWDEELDELQRWALSVFIK